MIYALSANADFTAALNEFSPCAVNSFLTCDEADNGLKNAKAGDVLIACTDIALEIVAKAIKTGRRKGMIIVLSPSVAAQLLPQEIYENAEILIANQEQTQNLTGIYPDCEVNLALAVKKFKHFGANNIVITLGELGSAVAVGHEITLFPVTNANAAYTAAADYTYISTFSTKIDSGENIIAAAEFATCKSTT